MKGRTGSIPSIPMIQNPYQYGCLFSLLSSLFLCEPKPELIGVWRDTLVRASIPGTQELREVLEALDPSDRDASENLRWEFTRLFVGPYHLPCPPYESVYTSRERFLGQDATREVQELYRNAGFTVADGAPMADHVGVELGFLAALVERATAEPSQAQVCADMANAFLASHLRNWVPRFAADLEEAAEYPLYPALSRLTRRVIEQEWPLPGPVPEGAVNPSLTGD